MQRYVLHQRLDPAKLLRNLVGLGVQVMMHRRASVLACSADASELHGHLQRVPETIDIEALVGA